MNIRPPTVHKQKSQETEMTTTTEEVEDEPASALIKILETSLSSRGEG